MVKLGQKVKDRITGFEGIVIAKCFYLNGCTSCQIRPDKLKEDGSIHETQWIDEQQLDNESKASSGGPGDVPPAMATP